MAFVFSRQFDKSTEQKMGAFFQTLSEKDQRRYAAMEAVKLAHEGITYWTDLCQAQFADKLAAMGL